MLGLTLCRSRRLHKGRSAVIEETQNVRSWERFVALIAAAVALLLNVAASVQLFTPPSAFGYHLIYTNGNAVAAVDRDTAAARAGIVAGDHLDFSRASLHDRLVGLEYQPALLGESIRFDVVRNGKAQAIRIAAGPLTPSEARLATFSPITSFLRLAGFAYIIVALFIVLRRPSRMTWGLFLYLVSATNLTLYRLPDWIFPIAQFASDLLSVAGPIGLVIFAARFPSDRAAGWKAWLDNFAIPIGAVFAIPNIAWDATSIYFGWSPSAWMSLGSILGAFLLLVTAAATLVVTYLGADRTERQRFQWVIAGVLFTLLSYASEWARYWSTTYPVASASASVWLATLLYACAPFALAYAVVRQRVFDISFVISRTLVYTILTGTIFALFALIEWLAGRLIEQSGVTIALVAATAVIVAFSLEAAHARIEGAVERVLFRRRHLAEQHLAGVAAGLPYAQSTNAVEHALVREPVEAYALSCASLYKRDDSGEFTRNGEKLDPSVALRLQGARCALRLQEFNGHVGSADENPVLAVPVFMRARLEAIALYGPHSNGEDIDTDEASSIEGVCAAAGLAYDQLDALRIYREIARWRRLAERQSRELAALRERTTLLGQPLTGDDADGHGAMHQ
jgi:hypothetical protein